MKNVLRIIAFTVVILLAASAFAGPISITNSNFSVVTGNCGSYTYQGPGSGNCPFQDLNVASGIGWTFGSYVTAGGPGDGLVTSAAGNPFDPPSFAGLPAGTQAAFLQEGGSVSQTLSGFTTGRTYDLSFYLGSRYIGGMGNQTVEVEINGLVIGTYALSSGTPFTLENLNFMYTGATGPATLEFLGTATGDQTAFVTDASITATPEPVTLMLFGTGLMGIGGMVRRKMSR